MTIPYSPRPVQREIHERLDASRFVVLVAHRRMGKTVLAVNHLIKRALKDGQAGPDGQLGKVRGVYGYVAPFRNQAKSIAWEYLKHYSANIPGRQVNEQELFVMLPGGARIRIFGADNPDALRGLYFDGVVLDEVAQMKTEVWDEIVRPALSDRKGWAVFIGTPKGVNLFHDLYLRASRSGDKDWSALLYRVGDTNALDPEEVETLRAEMSENAWRQEFLCDFSASSDDVLIPIDLASEAAGRVLTEADVAGAPLVVGVDVARMGSDSSVFFRRKGLGSYDPQVIAKRDNMEVADSLALYLGQHRPDATFADAGQGYGVIDRVRRLGFEVRDVNFGGKALRHDRFANRRAEMWYGLREWLQQGGALPNNSRLISELAAPQYFFNESGKIQLESKDKIKERLGFSPDLADALALTFAAPVRLATAARTAKARSSFDSDFFK